MTTQAPDGKDPMSGFFDAERSQGATASAQFGDGATAPPPSRCSGPAPWQETTSAMGEPPQPLPPRDGADDTVPAPPVVAALPRNSELDDTVESSAPMTEQEERVNEGLDLGAKVSPEAAEQPVEAALPRDGERDVVVGSTVPTMEQEKERVNEGLDLRESHPAVNTTSSPGAVPPVETPAPRDGDGGQDEAAVPSVTAMEQEQGNLIDLMEQGEPQPALAAKVSPASAEQPLETPTPHDGDIGGNDAARTTQPLRPLMTRKEMAEYLNATEATVTQLVRQGMPCIYLGLTRTGNRSCRMRFRLDKCMEWLERREN